MQSATKQATYDWFQKARAIQGDHEALYKHFLARVHAAYSSTEEHMKVKFSKLFEELDQLGASDKAIEEYDDRFSEIIGKRVESYHDTLKERNRRPLCISWSVNYRKRENDFAKKYYETLVSDFNERAQKQLFKFKTFLIGLATLYDHHNQSYDYRRKQWQDEYKVKLRSGLVFEQSN